MARILLSLSVLFLTLSAVFGVLNTHKARALRESADSLNPEQAETEQVRLAREKMLQNREAALAAVAAKKAETDGRLQSVETDLTQIQAEKTALEAKLQTSEAEIAELRKRVDGRAPSEPANADDVLPMPGAGDLQTQLEETRRQLDDAEREKALLASRVRSPAERAPVATAQPSIPTRRAVTRPAHPGLRGRVLAVNQAYNFVVLDLGGRRGLEADTEMLVLRRGTLIGKIRVSSVEPATAIGDIVSSSLARGVQVQPGDVVIYAGPNS